MGATKKARSLNGFALRCERSESPMWPASPTLVQRTPLHAPTSRYKFCSAFPKTKEGVLIFSPSSHARGKFRCRKVPPKVGHTPGDSHEKSYKLGESTLSADPQSRTASLCLDPLQAGVRRA